MVTGASRIEEIENIRKHLPICDFDPNGPTIAPVLTKPF